MRKKNILIITPNKDAYSETFIKSQIDNLKGNIFVLYNGFMPRKLWSGKSLAKEVSFIKYYFTKLFRPTKNIYEVGLANYIKKNKIDYVLAQYGQTGAKVTPVLRKHNVPLIVHFHGFDAYTFNVIEEYNLQYKEMFEYATKIIVVSKHMFDQLIRLGAPENKLLLNYYGPNPVYQEIYPEYESNQFLFIGRFVDKKAPYYLMLSFHELLKEHKEAKLVLIGDGPLFNMCVNLSKYLGINQSIEFVGVLDPSKILEYCQKSFCYIQHSITTPAGDSEGTPNSILEACAVGMPVISTEHAGIPDVIIHGRSGLLVKQHDVIGMAKSMKYLYVNRALAKEMGHFNKERINMNFSLKKYLENINSLFD